MINRITRKYKNFKKKSPFFKIQTLLELIPFRPVKIGRFFLMSIEDFPENIIIRGGSNVKFASKNDIDSLCKLENKPDLFHLWMDRGEHCIVAIDSEEIVGYIWFSIAEKYYEERLCYELMIRNDSIYTHNGYIKEEFRLRGIWVNFIFFMKNWLCESGRKQIITMVDYGNDHSLKTHLRFGFTVKEDVVWICFLGKWFFINKNIYIKWPNIKCILANDIN